MPVAVAMVAAAAIGAVATTSSANSNRRAAQRMTNQNNQLQRETYNRNAANLQPYISGGNAAFAAWQSFMGLSGGAANQNNAAQNAAAMRDPASIRDAALAGGSGQSVGQPVPQPAPASAAGNALSGAVLPADKGGTTNALSSIPGSPTVQPGRVSTGSQYVSNGTTGRSSSGDNLSGGVTQAGVSDEGTIVTPNIGLTGTEQPGGAMGGGGSGTATIQGPSYTYAGNSPSALANSSSGYQSFQNSLGYTQGLEEGMRGLNLRLATGGQLGSGDAYREAVRYNQQYANTFAGDYLDRLMQGAQLGAGAAGNLAGVSQNYANAVNSNNNTALNAQTAANNATGNALANLAGTAATAFAYGYGNRDSNALSSSYANGGGSYWG